jgi:Zn-dependent protease with chaperone function
MSFRGLLHATVSIVASFFVSQLGLLRVNMRSQLVEEACSMNNHPTCTTPTAANPQRRQAMRWACAACMLGGGGFALAREGVEVGGVSKAAKLVPAGQIEQAAAQQYQQMLQEAANKNALLPANHPQTQRLRTIASKIIPFTYEWNARAKNWKWEVNILNSNQINAFCMPGGKIAFYTGILEQLKLTDDEAAMIMGHEMAHALREHARERIGKQMATNIGISLGAQLLGLGNTGAQIASMGGQLLSLKFGREDESEADLVGLELAARSAYDPRAGVSLWQKIPAARPGSKTLRPICPKCSRCMSVRASSSAKRLARLSGGQR